MVDKRPELKQQRALGGILGDAWTLHRSQIGLYAVLVAPFVLFGIATSLLSYACTDDPGLLFVLALAFLPLDVLVYQLTSAPVTAIVKANAEGRGITTRDAFRAARRSDVLQVAWRLAIATVATFTLIGTYWGVKKLVQWSLAVAAVVLDDLRWNETLFRSERLVEGSWWATLGRLVTAALLLNLPAFMLGSMLASLVPGVFGIVVASLPYLLTASYPMIATVLIYTDRKARTNLFP